MELLTHCVVREHLVIEFVAACSKNNCLLALTASFLPSISIQAPENFVVSGDQFKSACIVNNRDLSDGFNSVAVVIEEHIAAACLLSFRSAETPFVRYHRIQECSGNRRDRRCKRLLIRSQGKEEAFGLHALRQRKLSRVRHLFAVGKIACLSRSIRWHVLCC